MAMTLVFKGDGTGVRLNLANAGKVTVLSPSKSKTVDLKPKTNIHFAA